MKLGYAGPTDQATNQAKHIEKNNSSWLTTQFVVVYGGFSDKLTSAAKLGIECQRRVHNSHRRSRWFLEVSESQKRNIHGISWDHHFKYFLAKNQPEPAAKIAKAFMGMSFRGLVWVEPFANLPSSL